MYFSVTLHNIFVSPIVWIMLVWKMQTDAKVFHKIVFGRKPLLLGSVSWTHVEMVWAILVLLQTCSIIINSNFPSSRIESLSNCLTKVTSLFKLWAICLTVGHQVNPLYCPATQFTNHGGIDIQVHLYNYCRAVHVVYTFIRLHEFTLW